MIVVGVLFFFAIGFVKLYQHRTERDAFVTTVAVLATTTVFVSSVTFAHFEGISDDLSFPCRHCFSVHDCGSKYRSPQVLGIT